MHLVIAAVDGVAIFRLNWSVSRTLGVCAVLGLSAAAAQAALG